MVRVMVPPDGFGVVIDQIHDWLRQRTGNNKNFAIHADNQPTVEAIGIYVNDIQIVSDLIEQYDLKLATRVTDQ